MKKILFAFVSLLVAAGVQAQKTHPDISSVLVKATVDPSTVKGPIKPMNAVNNGPNVGDDPQQMEDFRISARIPTKNPPMISAKPMPLSRRCWIPAQR